MNPLNLLNTAIDTLWYWTYGIIVGWGASFTILAALLLILFIKIVRTNRRITYLNNRLVSFERDTNITLNKINK
jgi:hypothetical protein